MKRVLFLYTELADYFLKCCEELANTAEVHIIRWAVNKEAPFEFEHSDKIKIYDKANYNFKQLKNLVTEINPDIIFCSGWVDKDYLKLTKPYFKKIPTVMSCDTHWRGDLKQYVATLLSRVFLLRTFSAAWVPGNAQLRYVKNMGFKKIKTGFYSCDLKKFNAVYEKTKPEKEKNYPKRFLYVGRYYDFKGITDLWQAFIELQAETPNNWELWCLGTGSLEPVQHEKIKHFGFVQPKDLEPVLEKSGVFVLPSRFEPWGVVAHEYAAAGFPMILSKAVGAKETFLNEGKNGFSFQPKNIYELKTQLKNIINLSDKELLLMSENSHNLAQTISPQKWAAAVVEFYKEFNAK